MINAVFVGNERVMVSALNKPAAVEHRNIVAEAAGRKAVTDIYGGFVAHNGIEV